MSSGGSIAAMISSIKNNKALIGKRRSYFEIKIELKSISNKMKIVYRKATPEQLRLIRTKLKKQRIIRRIKTAVVLLVLSPMFVYVALNLWGVIEEEIPKSENQILMEYYTDIRKGDEYFNKKQFENAVIMYNRADVSIRSTNLIDLRIGLVSTFECFLKKENCGHAAWVVNNLQRKDSLNPSVIKLRELLIRGYKLNNPDDSLIIAKRWRKEDGVFEQFFGR